MAGWMERLRVVQMVQCSESLMVVRKVRRSVEKTEQLRVGTRAPQMVSKRVDKKESLMGLWMGWSMAVLTALQKVVLKVWMTVLELERQMVKRLAVMTAARLVSYSVERKVVRLEYVKVVWLVGTMAACLAGG